MVYKNAIGAILVPVCVCEPSAAIRCQIVPGPRPLVPAPTALGTLSKQRPSNTAAVILANLCSFLSVDRDVECSLRARRILILGWYWLYATGI